MLKIFMPLWFPIPIIKATIFKQFCGGESINDCEKTIKRLSNQNVKTILDYSVEGIEDEKTLQEAIIVYFQASRTLKKTLNHEVVPFWDEATFIAEKKHQILTAK